MTIQPQAYTPTVYITNFKGQDIGHARNFGEIKAITTDKVIETFKLDQLVRRVTESLANSHPEDWLITSGHMILGILAAIEMLRLHKRLNLLIWHAKAKQYLPRVLTHNSSEDPADPALTEMLLSEVPYEIA